MLVGQSIHIPLFECGSERSSGQSPMRPDTARLRNRGHRHPCTQRYLSHVTSSQSQQGLVPFPGDSLVADVTRW